MKSKQKLHGKSSNDFRFESCNQKDFNFVISGNDLTESIFEISCFKMSQLTNGWLTWRIVGCVMWCPLTNVNPSAWSGVTVQTPSWSDIRQCRACIDGPKSCKAFVFADPTSTGSVVSFNLLPPSPECVISMSTGPSRSAVMLPPPLLIPRGFFLRRRGCVDSAGRRRTWNMMDPERKEEILLHNSIIIIWFRWSLSRKRKNSRGRGINYSSTHKSQGKSIFQTRNPDEGSKTIKN